MDQNTIKLTDGKTVGFKKGTITKADGTTVDMDHYEVYGLKYVPVAVRTEDYAAFCQKYNVVTNDGVLEGGYGEVQLSAYTATAAVTADTNGLKYAVKNGDSFTFEARKTGADSGIKDSGSENGDKCNTDCKRCKRKLRRIPPCRYYRRRIRRSWSKHAGSTLGLLWR